MRGRNAAIAAAVGAVVGFSVLAQDARAEGTLADSNGQIVAWGDNGYGQTNVPAGTDYTAIAAGGYHSLALKSDGSLAGWGNNDNGEATVPAGTDYAAIAAGFYHSLALKSDGSLAAWGYNSYGQTSVPAGTNYAAIAAGGLHSLVLKSDGSLAAWGDNGYGQTDVPAGTNYTAIAAGGYHSLALKSDGSLAGWGNNELGQTDVPAGTNYTGIAAGFAHNLALKSDGSLAGWGRNDYGEAVVPTGLNYTAIAAGGFHSLALKSDGSLAGWGNNDYGQATVPAGTFVAVSAGRLHSLALVARSDYSGDLLVSGPANGIKAQLNRSITVAGNMTIDHTTMSAWNTPVATIAGDLVISSGGLTGSSFLTAGVLQLKGPASIGGGADVWVTGIRGSALLTLDGGTLTTGPQRTFTGSVNLTNSSVLQFSGSGQYLSGALTSGTGSEVRVGPGQAFLAGSAANAGSLQVVGSNAGLAQLEVSGTATNTGQIIADNAALRFRSGLGNQGSLAVSGSGASIYGAVNNAGAASTVIVTGGATATFADSFTNNGELRVSKSGSTASKAVILGAYSGAGSITGGGDIFFEGAVSPGGSPAFVTIDGNVTFGNGATTSMELGGTAAGQYDRITITGNAQYGGAMDVVSYGGFAPRANDQFQLFAAGSSSGAFSSVDLPALAPGLSWDTTALYSAGMIGVVPEPGALVVLLSAGLLLRRRRRGTGT